MNSMILTQNQTEMSVNPTGAGKRHVGKRDDVGMKFVTLGYQYALIFRQTSRRRLTGVYWNIICLKYSVIIT